ncbi:MAG: hypothetical protein NC223_03555 [Butyrivibrio sp.]|nr:hypothetical protein [Butyrivibrio sp.]
MKKKRIGKRVLAAVLAAVICAVGFVGFMNREKVMALFGGVEKAVGMVSGLTDEEAARFYASYTGATLDMVNGEVVLTADRKANVLTNIYRNKEKLTILEIVPYELASVYNVLIPSNEQREKIEAYGDEIFNTFDMPFRIEPLEWAEGMTWDEQYRDPSTRLLTSGSRAQDWETGYWYEVSNSKKYSQGAANVIASRYQPIELYRSGDEGSYEYSVLMPNYYIDNLLAGYEETKIYDYFANNDNVELKIVVPGQVTASELQKILLGTDNGSNDPVDFIYIGGYAVANYGESGNIYRNVFFGEDVPDDEAGRQKMMNLAKTGEGADDFHTNVYRADGTEYKVSELVSEKVWFNSYSKDADGNLKSNDLEWNEVEMLMNYIFGSYNRNCVHTDESGAKQQQRVSCEFQIATLSEGIFKTDSSGCDNNIGKLYYLLCKTSDQASDEEGCSLDSTKGYTSVHHTEADKSTHTPYFEFATYYGAENYFLKGNGFDTVNLVENSNGVQTATYNGSAYWNFNFTDRQGVYAGNVEESDFSNPEGEYPDEKYPYETAKIANGEIFPNVSDNDFGKQYELFYLHNVFNGRFAVYNGMLGVDPSSAGNLLNFGLSHVWGEGGWRNKISHQRLDLAVGENFMDQFNIVNYLLGVDETDFITKPDAYFTGVEIGYSDGNTVKYAEQGADKNAFFVYLYDDDFEYDAADSLVNPEIIKINYAAEDESAKMTGGVLKAYNLNGTELATLAEYTESDLEKLEIFEAAYDISADAEVYQAFMDGNIYFTFTIENKTTIKGVEKVFTDTAYLYLKHRNIFDLD